MDDELGINRMSDVELDNVLFECEYIVDGFNARKVESKIALCAMSSLIVSIFKQFGNAESFKNWLRQMQDAYESPITQEVLRAYVKQREAECDHS